MGELYGMCGTQQREKGVAVYEPTNITNPLCL